MIERSTEIQEAIEKVRSIHVGEHNENAVEKKEKAQHLRMEIELKTSAVITKGVQILVENPSIDLETLSEELQKSSSIAYPEAITQFAQTMLNTVEIVSEGLNSLEKVSKDPAMEIFKAILNKQEKDLSLLENNEIEYQLINDFPFAVHISANEKCIDLISGNNDEASFWPCMLVTVGNKAHYLPIIVTPIEANFEADVHEKTHLINSQIQTATEYIQKSGVIWGGVKEYYLDVLVIADELKNETEDSLNLPENQAQVQIIIKWALALAKDEFLAGISETITTPNLKSQPEEVVKGIKKHYLDKYLQEYLHIPENSVLAINLKQKLTSDLDIHTKNAGELIENYKDYDTLLLKRLNLIGGVLAQKPISEWNAHLENTGYFEELKALEEQMRQFSALEHNTRPLLKYDETLNEKDRVLVQEIAELKEKYMEQISEGCDIPLFELFKEYTPKLVELKSRMENSDIYQLHQVHEKTKASIKSLNSRIFDEEFPIPEELQDLLLEKIDKAEKTFFTELGNEPKSAHLHLIKFQGELLSISTKLPQREAQVA